MERTNKTRIFSVVSTLMIVALAVIVLCAGLSVAPTAYADPTLPFTLVAPRNVTMVKNDGDAPTSMGFPCNKTLHQQRVAEPLTACR